MLQLTNDHKELAAKIVELADCISQHQRDNPGEWHVIPGGLDNVSEVRTMDGITVYKKGN